MYTLPYLTAYFNYKSDSHYLSKKLKAKWNDSGNKMQAVYSNKISLHEMEAYFI
jgi:hypothetical protein